MHSVKHLHTFGLPINCNRLVVFDSIESASKFLKERESTNFLLLGEGSNCIFTEDFDGDLLKPAIWGKHYHQDPVNHYLKVAAGENWHDLVVWCLQKGIYGLENLALIPGSVGAVPIQNIGAYGLEVERFIESVEYIDLEDGNCKHLSKLECEFGYRDSIFKNALKGKVVITYVYLKIPKQWIPVTDYAELKQLANPSAIDIFNTVVKVRKTKLPDPNQQGNAGSFFKNPVVETVLFEQLQQQHPDIPHYVVSDTDVKIPAAWLIDQLGFKGKRYGGIGCHHNQPLVLVNLGNGTGEELLHFARNIRDSVQASFGVTLENEVNLIGRHGPINL